MAVQAKGSPGSGPLWSSAVVMQRLSAPLRVPDDVGNVYELRLGRETVRGRFKSLGRSGMHWFDQLSGEDAGETCQVHYVNILRRVPATSGREIDAEKMFASRIRSDSGSASTESMDEAPRADPLRFDVARVREFVASYPRAEPLRLKLRKERLRLGLHTDDSSILKAQLRSRKKVKSGQKYIDLTYHEFVEMIDTEWKGFLGDALGTLTLPEAHAAYDEILAGQSGEKEGNTITGTGPSPLTAMAPTLLAEFQDMHYQTEILKEDETVSTRAYEMDFTKTVTEQLPFSQWRALGLPEASSAEETSMVNALGGFLDVQVPTSGKTIGSGKNYSAIFKHFQRAMELLNDALDKQGPSYEEEGFLARTRRQSEALDSASLGGLYDNEKARFEPDVFRSWDELARTIDTIVVLIAASLDLVPDDPQADFEPLSDLDALEGSDAAIVKQFELIGTILGLMIKSEKRQVLNHQLLGSDKKVREHLNNLYQLARLEQAINRAIPKSKHDFSKLERAEQHRRQVRSELEDLRRK